MWRGAGGCLLFAIYNVIVHSNHFIMWHETGKKKIQNRCFSTHTKYISTRNTRHHASPLFFSFFHDDGRNDFPPASSSTILNPAALLAAYTFVRDASTCFSSVGHSSSCVPMSSSILCTRCTSYWLTKDKHQPPRPARAVRPALCVVVVVVVVIVGVVVGGCGGT